MTLLDTVCVLYWVYCYRDTHITSKEIEPVKTDPMHNLKRLHIRVLERL